MSGRVEEGTKGRKRLCEKYFRNNRGRHCEERSDVAIPNNQCVFGQGLATPSFTLLRLLRYARNDGVVWTFLCVFTQPRKRLCEKYFRNNRGRHCGLGMQGCNLAFNTTVWKTPYSGKLVYSFTK
ncbi:MAG: hypothetical protein LBG80_17375 [Bacteroidales bacterium]|jgi:hypothetical protein|nr:hypothetical protein [Bacteroidales bacterium]